MAVLSLLLSLTLTQMLYPTQTGHNLGPHFLKRTPRPEGIGPLQRFHELQRSA